MSTQIDPTTAALELEPYKSLDDKALVERIGKVRDAMGPKLLILGHHYQQDSVIAFADYRGDSYKLSAQAAESRECEAILFCGVHFMAETADILANRPERLAERNGRRVPVVLPNVDAGCSLAAMASVGQVEDCWRQLGQVIDTDDVTPITYVNSTAALKAFCSRHGGIVCTSANADKALRWAFEQRSRALFFPDQHLGRNTARAMEIPLEQMPLWNPREPVLGGNSEETIRDSRVILWKGHCKIHQMFLPEHIDFFRKKYPGIKVIVHPECPMEVVERADLSGSTSKILEAIESSPPGTRWAVGTELNMVSRLTREHPDKEIHFLSPIVAVCPTMFRINLPNLCWSLENLAAGTPVNVIEVDAETAAGALEALKRMLELS